MRWHGGARRFRRSEDGEGEDVARWRWVSLSLVVLLHAGIYLLLRSAGEAVPLPPREEERRIRLTWSLREPLAPVPEPGQVAKVPVPPTATGTAVRSRPSRARANDILVAPPATPALHTDPADTWSIDAARPGIGEDGVPGNRFRRDVFDRRGPDALAPPSHLPGLRMRDRSLGGWLQAEARRRACADLRGALSGRPESSAAIMASMQRWECDS